PAPPSQPGDVGVTTGRAAGVGGFLRDGARAIRRTAAVRRGGPRLYDMAGVSTLSSAIIVNNTWLGEAKNEAAVRRFLRASQRGWQYTFDHRAEAADNFLKPAPAFNKEIRLLAITGTRPSVHTKKHHGQPPD